MSKLFIGSKEIKTSKILEEKMRSGIELVDIEYQDGTKEVLSKLMYDKVVAEESCDATALREKRIYPVVVKVLEIMRDYGIKISETSYFSAVLNTSLNANTDEAYAELWREYIPTIRTLDDIDLVAIDRVLKDKKTTIDDILKGQDK